MQKCLNLKSRIALMVAWLFYWGKGERDEKSNKP
jgi:hypothetical protein